MVQPLLAKGIVTQYQSISNNKKMDLLGNSNNWKKLEPILKNIKEENIN
jgi:hypothetical protein